MINAPQISPAELSQATASDYDVVIAGGGLAGLTLAVQVLQRRPHTRIAVLERQPFPVPEAAHKVGEATVEIGAHYFREVLGLEDHLEQAQIRKLGLRFFMSSADNRAIADRLEVGSRRYLPSRTYQLDRGRFENELAARGRTLGATIYDDARVLSIDLDRARPHRVRFSRDGCEETLSAQWVIDASGRRALLKHKLDLTQANDHDVNAVWFRLRDMIRIDDLIDLDDPAAEDAARDAWRERVEIDGRWRSTNHLVGPGYWAWLIPLASGSVSIGIVADPTLVPFEEVNNFDKALRWLHGHEPQLAVAVEQRREGLQDFKMLRHYSHGCQRVYSPARWAITGEAGAFLDPLYSPGSDFIAISNTFVTDLITRDLAGQSVDERAESYDSAYLTAFRGALDTWRHQYPLMGHPQIFAAKIAWDTLTYFATTNLLFVNDALCDLDFMASLDPWWTRYSELSARMQRFFREWAALDDGHVAPERFVDLSEPLYARLNGELLDRLDENKLRTRLKTNVTMLEGLAIEIYEGAARRLGAEIDTRELDAISFDLATALERPGAKRESDNRRERAADDRTGVFANLWIERPSAVDGAGER